MGRGGGERIHCGNTPVKNNLSFLVPKKRDLLIYIFILIGEIDGVHFSCLYLKCPPLIPQKANDRPNRWGTGHATPLSQRPPFCIFTSA